ncbi:non-ribosomal peptide synthetase [Yersinia rochesterensis]|nr:non-ribosomal peptide synthetase [Yersinia rochesterensis]
MDNKLGALILNSFQKYPERIALETEFSKLTYKELLSEVNEVLRLLISKNVTYGSKVIVELKRGPECIYYILALIKLGAIYIPIDPDHPEIRKSFIKEDVNAEFIISKKNSLDEKAITEIRKAKISHRTGKAAEAGPQLAYILYTSGTTGKPKGVKIKASAVASLLNWMTKTYGFDTETRILNKTALTFDASVWEMLIPFICGGTLCLADPDKDIIPNYLIEMILRFNINTVQFVPAMLRKVLNEPAFKQCRSLKNVFVGGEILTNELAKAFFSASKAALHNLYGPTETTIQVLTHTVTKADLLNDIPVGRPVSGVQAYILSQNENEAAVDEIGELCISGIALAEGYISCESEERKRFVFIETLPDSPRVYRTGDLAYRNIVGDIFFCGRLDEQIKINGYRVDLNEIEAVLNTHHAVDSVVVSKESNGDLNRLIAFLKCNKTEDALFEQLTDQIQNTLPHYMWPADYYIVDEIPLTAHAKTDRKTLFEKGKKIKLTQRDKPESNKNTKLKKSILHIWQDTLNNKEIGLDSDFYSCGGNSVEAMIIAMKIREQEGINFSLEEILRFRNVRNIADSIS